MDRFMPKVFSPSASGNNSPALSDVYNGTVSSSYWNFIGIEFSTQDENAITGFNLILIGALYALWNDEQARVTGLGQVPHHVHFDRCYIHGRDQQPLRHGLTLWSHHCNITNCYFANFLAVSGSIWTSSLGTVAAGSDAQAISLVGPGPFNFINNYLEATSQSVLCGAGGGSPSAVPGPGGNGPILFRYNTFTKDIRWNNNSQSYIRPSSSWDQSSHDWLIKNCLEFKNGQNVTIDRNIFQYSWDGPADSQNGGGCTTNLINYSGFGTPGNGGWEQVKNITYTNNILDSINYPIQFASEPASQAVSGSASDLLASQVLSTLVFRNNHCTNVSWANGSGTTNRDVPPGPGADYAYEPKNYALMRLNPGNISAVGAEGITFDHNTFIPAPGFSQITAFFSDGTGLSPTVNGLQVTNNIGYCGNFGLLVVVNGAAFTGNSESAIQTSWPGVVLGGNTFWGTPSAIDTDMPTIFSKLAHTKNFKPGDQAENTNNYFPNSQAAVGLQSSTISFPGAGQYGSTLSFTAYQLPSSSTLKATDSANSGLSGCDTSLLAWARAARA
jgi:hypothetical protein